jgi:hypothetical protein
MRNQLFRSDNLGSRGRYQVLQEYIPRDKEVAFAGATQNEDVIGVRQATSQSAHSREQSFSFREIHWQHSQMISDPFELRPISRVRREKQFLKHNRVNGEANKAIRFGGKQLCCRRVAPKVSEDHVCVQEHEWWPSIRMSTLLQRLGCNHLFHPSHCM